MPEIIQVTEKIWCVRQRSYFACSYVVTTSTGTYLIDAGMSSEGTEMLVAIESVGIRPETIRAILLTHWHNDHAAGAQSIAASTQAKVLYNEMDAPFFNRKAARVGVLGLLGDWIPELGPLVLFKGLLGNALPNAVAATDFVHDQEILFDDFEVIETPGHTKGHVSYYFRPAKALFAGDALAVVGEQLRFMARPVTPDLKAARNSMKVCLERDIDIVCPGHRQPLSRNVAQERRRLLSYLEASEHWPLLG